MKKHAEISTYFCLKHRCEKKSAIFSVQCILTETTWLPTLLYWKFETYRVQYIDIANATCKYLHIDYVFFNWPIDHQLTSNDRLKPVMTTGLVNMHIDRLIANLD